MLPPSRKRRSQNSTIVDNITSAQKQLQFQNFKRIKQSEFRPEATTKKQCEKDRSQEELPKKFLGLCLASYGGSSVSYFVLKLISIGSSDQSLQSHEIQFPSSDDGDCFGMACGVVGSNLYFFGCLRTEKESSYSGTKGKHAAPLPSGKIWLGYSGELLKSSKVNHTPFSLLKEVVTVDSVPVSVVSLIVPIQSPQKMHLAVGKGSGSFDVLICDISTTTSKSAKIGSYGAHDHIVTGLAWAFDGCCLYSCSQDNSVRSWILRDHVLCEVPYPSNTPGARSSSDVPNVFDSCFGLATSPGNLVVAVARSFDADLLNPMYQARD